MVQKEQILMNGTEFLKFAQKSTVYTNKFKNLKKPLLEECVIEHEGVKYYPMAVSVQFTETGETENVAKLHDVKGNCVVWVDLNELKK